MMAAKRTVFGTLAICFCLPAATLSAQPSPSDSSNLTAAMEHMRRQYQQFMSTAAPLYSGPQYVEYDQRLDRGQPFFLSAAFQLGSIRYDRILYENIPFKFDQVQSRLVLTDASGTFKLSPSNDKIDEFTIAGHSFVKLEKTPNTPTLPGSGFYEVLHTNSRFSVLKKENKTIEEELRNWGGGAFRNIVSSVNYYLKEGNTYRSIGKKKQLLAYTKDKKTEVRLFIRKNKPDFSKDMDNALISVLTYYYSLVN